MTQENYMITDFRPVAKGEGWERSNDSPPPALTGHFSADCSSANILNIVRV